jgi:hypothetical protein
MSMLDFFRLRADGRCEPAPDIAQLDRDLDDRLARRRAARAIPNPHKRGHMTRMINQEAR